jgi:hypothetical protein
MPGRWARGDWGFCVCQGVVRIRTESGARMPGLNLLAEYKLDFSRVLLFSEGENFGVDCVEEFFGVLGPRRSLIDKLCWLVLVFRMSDG